MCESEYIGSVIGSGPQLRGGPEPISFSFQLARNLSKGSESMSASKKITWRIETMANLPDQGTSLISLASDAPSRVAPALGSASVYGSVSRRGSRRFECKAAS
jgi:hypothetical protein